MRLFSFIKNKLGIDKAIFFTSLARTIQAIGGVVTIFLISLFLTKEEQGYYYTFASVLAIQIFFELGLGGIMTQFVAHEKAKLVWETNYQLNGSIKHLSRLSSLLNFSLKWYAVFSVLLVIAINVVGFIFFSKYGNSISGIKWQSPLFLLSISAGLYLFISPWMAIFQGLGKVKEMARFALIQQIVVIFFTWCGLIAGAKLYILAINLGASSICLLILYRYSHFLKIFRTLFSYPISEKIRYFEEIFPMQWKIAVSWMSGYLIFQLFNPVVFAVEGSVIAGQMGMTLAALNAILTLILSWTNTKVPVWSSLIANGDYSLLDKSFYKTLFQSTGVGIVLILSFVVLLFLLGIMKFQIIERFLPIYLVVILSLTILLNNIINGWATYLRCHKQEPFMWQSIIVGVSTACTIILLSKQFGVNGVVWGYASIIILSMPSAYFIFVTKKKEWH